MSKALSRSYRSLDDDARETARAAARRSGKSLHDWLDDAIREKARSPSYDDDEDEDFIAPDDEDDRLAAVSRRLARSSAGSRRNRREPRRGRDDADAIAQNAAALVERRLAESERHTTRALEGIAKLIERRDERDEDQDDLEEVVDRLGRIENRISRQPEQDGLEAVVDRLGRIENQIARQPEPAAMARPIRGALARLESRIDNLSKDDRGEEFGRALAGLDKRLDDIARRLESDGPERVLRPTVQTSLNAAHTGVSASALERGPHRPEPRPQPTTRLPLADAIAQIAERRRFLDGDASAFAAPPVASGPRRADAPFAEPRLEALQRSLDDLSRQMQDARAQAGEKAEQQIVAMRQIESVRREVEQLSGALGDLASRASVSAIESALRDLARRIDTQRERGVADAALAPAERIAVELRSVLKELDPSPMMRNLRADVETIGRRLDELSAPGGADSRTLRDLSQQTHEIKDMLASLAARPLPVEKLETRLFDLTQRVDGLSFTSGVGAGDLNEVARSIRSIVAAETDGALQGFTQRLEKVAGKLEDVLATAGAKRFDELTSRIDQLGESLARRMDASPLENLVAQLGEKIDAALEPGAGRGGFETLERQIGQMSDKLDRLGGGSAIAGVGETLAKSPSQLRELTDRIDFVHNALAARIEDGVRGRDAARAQEIAVLVDQLTAKLNGALDPKKDGGSLKSLEEQIQKLASSLDQGDRNVAALSSIEHKMGELFARLEDSRTVTAREAERAVRQATQEILREAAANDAGALNHLVERELLDIRNSQNESGLRTHETLTAVHETLERVVDRLAAFEDELSEIRSAPASRAARPAAVPAAQASAFAPRVEKAGPRAAAPTSSPDEVLERLLEPGGNKAGQRPRKAASAAETRDDRSVQSDFIAAARRAAQQAAADAEAAEAGTTRRASPRREATADDAPEGEGVLARVGASLQARKRPLLLGFGALVLLVGAYQVARVGIEGPGVLTHAVQGDVDGGKGDAAHSDHSDAQHPPTTISPSDAKGKDASPVQAKREEAAPPVPVQKFAPPPQAVPGPNMNSYVPPNVVRPGSSAPRPTPAPVAAPPGAPQSGLGPNGANPGAPLSGGGRPGVGPTFNAPLPGAPLLGPAPAPRAPGPSASVGGSIDPETVGSINRPAQDAGAVIKSLAAQGDASAQFELGARLVEGRGVARDPKSGAEWFEKAAAQGLAVAQYRLGSMYEKGVGVDRDFARARKWYQAAAEGGNARSMHNLAVLSAEGGGGGKPDYATAAEWFRKAAEFGVRDSQYNLAILYARGLGVQQSLVQSYMWFAAAAQQGDVDAGKKRDDVGARLDSKELVAAKALVDGFRPKQPAREANDAAPPAGGWDAVKPPPVRPAGKPKIS